MSSARQPLVHVKFKTSLAVFFFFFFWIETDGGGERMRELGREGGEVKPCLPLCLSQKTKHGIFHEELVF